MQGPPHPPPHSRLSPRLLISQSDSTVTAMVSKHTLQPPCCSFTEYMGLAPKGFIESLSLLAQHFCHGNTTYSSIKDKQGMPWSCLVSHSKPLPSCWAVHPYKDSKNHCTIKLVLLVFPVEKCTYQMFILY